LKIMTLATQIVSDLPVFFNTDEFATSVVYTPNGGAATTITILEDTQNAGLQDPDSVSDEKVIVVKYTDLNTPDKGDTFVLNSEIWYIVGNLGGGQKDGIWMLRASRSARRAIV